MQSSCFLWNFESCICTPWDKVSLDTVWVYYTYLHMDFCFETRTWVYFVTFNEQLSDRIVWFQPILGVMCYGMYFFNRCTAKGAEQ